MKSHGNTHKMFIDGQRVSANNNAFFVHRSIVDPFVKLPALKCGGSALRQCFVAGSRPVKEFKTRVSRMRAGSGFEDGVSIGPPVDSAVLQKVEQQFSNALDRDGIAEYLETKLRGFSV